MTSTKTTTKNDVFASLVVFLVAVPLASAIALASGAPSVVPGLIACAVGGIVVGTLGGSRLQISGPAAGLAVVIYGLIQQFGWPVACAATALAGVLQIGLGLARVARVSLAITPAVAYGMLAGIGVVITLSQAHIVLGGTPQYSALESLRELPVQIRNLPDHSVLLGLLTIAILFGWQHVPARLQLIPGALVAVLTSTLISNIVWSDVKRVTLTSNLSAAFALPQLPRSDWSGFLVATLTVALVASVKSLLSAVATDKLHSEARSNLDRELIGQGVANMLSGLIGGLPVAGVIVRSAANVRAGAHSQYSAVLHGIWIVVFTAFFLPLVERIPLSALAGLLVFVGVKLISPHDIRNFTTHREIAVYFVTMIGVVFWNILGGLGLGIGLSIFLLLRRLTSTRINVEARGEQWHVRMEGSLTFLSVPQIMTVLNGLPAGAIVDIDLMVDFMDHAAFDALHEWRVTHEQMGGKVDIDELHENWYERAEQGQPLEARDGKVGRLSNLKSLLYRHKARDIGEVAANVAAFNAAVPEIVWPLFSELAQEGQNPRMLFIGCADSRVVPDLIAGTDPGDLFTLRNIGNLVPTYQEAMAQADSSVLATLEYAIQVLKVENVIVCGHSECGAMKALLNAEGIAAYAGLQAWLQFGQTALERFRKTPPETESEVVTNRLAQINVRQQLENLRSYPFVKQRLEEESLQLWGWFFNIDEAQLYTLEAHSGHFVKLDAQVAQSLLPTV